MTSDTVYEELELTVYCAVCRLVILRPQDCNMELYRFGWPVHKDSVCERQIEWEL